MAVLLFDLDGTLADTNPDLHAAMNYILGQHGLAPLPQDKVRHLIGGGAAMILQRGFAEHGVTLSDTDMAAATEEFVLWYDQNIDHGTRIFDNLIPILDRALARKIKMGVVTNKREGLAAKLLFRLNLQGYFDVLIGGDTLATRKPEPEMLHKAMTKLGGTPQDTVLLGDSEADTGAAHAAGVKCVCFSFGYRRVPLEELGADAIIDDYAELPKTLDKLMPGVFAGLLAD
ncbi:MAG: HAD-IA family hydrolase [Pseudomonadota bacterium]|nr:HAD-IA family hydrolase [Pseudomonadota bacterium]